MRHGFVLAALLLPLAGCYLPPQPAPSYGYGAPGYAPQGYGQPGYPPPGYPPPGYDTQIYPGYSYNDGAPTLLVEGAAVPLIVVGGELGYYDAHHYWHRAPDPVAHNLAQRYPGGAAYRPGGGGYPPPRPPGGGYPPPRPPDGGYPHPVPTAGAEPYHGQPQQYRPPPARPAPQAEHEEHPHNRECPPGQRC